MPDETPLLNFRHFLEEDAEITTEAHGSVLRIVWRSGSASAALEVDFESGRYTATAS